MTKRSELMVISLGRVLGAALTLAGFFVLTRLLPPEEYALVALLMAFSSFAGLVMINPAGQWTNRHVHEWFDERKLIERLGELLWLVLMAAWMVGGLAAAWCFFVIHARLASTVGAALAVAAGVFLPTAALSISAALNSLGFRREAVIVQLTVNGLGLVLAAVFVQLEASALLWLAGQAIGALPAYLWARRALGRVVGRPDAPPPDSPARQPFYRDRSFRRFALGLTTVTMLMWLEGNGYRFILERAWSARELGLFLMALSIPAQMTAVLESIVMQFAYPYFYRSLAGLGDSEAISIRTSAMTGTLLPLYWLWGGLLFVIAPQFLYLVAGLPYHAASEWLVYGILLEVTRLTGNAWQLAAQATKDFRPLIAPFAVGAVGNLSIALLMGVELGNSPAAIGAAMVVVAGVKATFICLRARSALHVRVSGARTAAAGLALAGGLLGHSVTVNDYGAWTSIAMLFCSGTVFLALAYLHLTTAQDFKNLLQHNLS